MFDKFDSYILEFIKDDFSVDYWYDEGASIAENMLSEFKTNDWELLFKAVPERTIEWKKRLAYCLHDGDDINQLKILLELIETEDSELFELVVDSLRSFKKNGNLNWIQTNSQIISRIDELTPKAGVVTNRVFEDFLK